MHQGKHIYKITVHGEFALEADIAAALAPLGLSVTGQSIGYSLYTAISDLPKSYPGLSDICQEMIDRMDHTPDSVHEFDERLTSDFLELINETKCDDTEEFAERLRSELLSAEWDLDPFFVEQMVADVLKTTYWLIERGNSLETWLEKIPQTIPGLANAVQNILLREKEKTKIWCDYAPGSILFVQVISVCNTDEIAVLAERICKVIAEDKQIFDAQYMTHDLIEAAYRNLKVEEE